VTISVVIADDQALVPGGFRVLVDTAADMAVLGEAGDGTQAVALARQHHPDVVLMDVRMPGQDGIEATRQIKEGDDTAEVKVLILTTFDLDEYVYAALRAGASGFMLKDTSPEQLLEAIRIVASGEALLAPTVTRRLIEAFAARDEPALAAPGALDALTEREREVLHEVLQLRDRRAVAHERCHRQDPRQPAAHEARRARPRAARRRRLRDRPGPAGASGRRPPTSRAVRARPA
jgi:DNA-binding NarL/FixJ family response regulator